MNKLVIYFLVILFAITGCAQMEANRIAELEQQREKQILSFQKECEAYGFVKGTDSFGNCMLKLSQRAVDNKNRDADRDAYRDAHRKPFKLEVPDYKGTFNRGLKGYGSTNSIHCTSKKVFGAVQTDCY